VTREPAPDPKAHWERVWREKRPDEVSWHQRRPTHSLELIAASGAGPGTPLVDVGGGASPLVDTLLEAGWQDLTVLDISGAALAHARARLGPAATRIRWVEADVTAWAPEAGRYGLWHDRAVLHFLTTPETRARYVERLRTALRPGGWAVIATFAPDGPERCSGLPVRRYDAELLLETLGDGFELVEERRETHRTPAGAEQRFAWFLLRHKGSGFSGTTRDATR